MDDTQERTHIADVRTVGVPVTDQDAALEFYVEKLGFEKQMDAQLGEGERWVEVAPSGATTTIALVLQRAGEPIGVDTGVRFTSSDVAGDHAQLRARGVDVDAELITFPVPMFSFRDADGNRLVIVGTGGER